MTDDVKKIAGAERPAMTPLDQAEAILKAAEEATPGEWCYASYGRENLYAVGVAFGDYDQPLSGLVTAEEYTVAEPVAVDIYGAANARFIALARNTAPDLATALIEKHRALEEARSLIAELLASTGYDKADRKTLQNEYMAGGKGAGTILSCLNFLARQGATA